MFKNIIVIVTMEFWVVPTIKIGSPTKILIVALYVKNMYNTKTILLMVENLPAQ